SDLVPGDRLQHGQARGPSALLPGFSHRQHGPVGGVPAHLFRGEVSAPARVRSSTQRRSEFGAGDVLDRSSAPVFPIHVCLGRYPSAWFDATKSGTYHLFCSQYCGTNHSGMVGEVIVLEPAEYQNWLSNQAEGSVALEGRKLFLQYRCISCHSATGDARAPSL